MANFDKAYELLLKWEGGYANHLSDNGGETLFGISRKAHPDLDLWRSVDEYKKTYPNDTDFTNKNPRYKTVWQSITAHFRKDTFFTYKIKNFYLLNYWKPLKCEPIPCQEFAENLFLLGVNAGLKAAIKIGQQACDIVSDGIQGVQTEKAFLSAGDKEVSKFTELEIDFYKSIVERNPRQQVNLEGWIKRARSV